MNKRILIVDDESSIRMSLKDVLEYEGYETEEAPDGKAGLEKLKSSHFDAVLCDIRMPKMDGVELLKASFEFSDAPFIMISGHGTIDTAVDAIKKGAYDFIEKPIELNRLFITLRNAFEKSYLVKETKVLKKKISKEYEMIGKSIVFEDINNLIDKVAPSDARVLITGANGTGKEMVARKIHELSGRSSGPFVEVNCAAIPSELIESELFGHEKGSFTSAIKQHKGNFEQANGGTLFLDEIGDMSLSAQAKVLRALQENKFTRIGGEKEIPFNVRVVAATNKNLKEEIGKGTFREDLYHRLSVILIHVPLLRERAEDIPLLADYFLSDICQKQGRKVLTLEPGAIQHLQSMSWTGNVRELKNIIERLAILCDKTITKEDVKRYANW